MNRQHAIYRFTGNCNSVIYGKYVSYFPYKYRPQIYTLHIHNGVWTWIPNTESWITRTCPHRVTCTQFSNQLLRYHPQPTHNWGQVEKGQGPHYRFWQGMTNACACIQFYGCKIRWGHSIEQSMSTMGDCESVENDDYVKHLPISPRIIIIITTTSPILIINCLCN